jgi:hypothetical protein
LKFLLRFTGFRPDSDVKISRRGKTGVLENAFKASERGEVVINLQVAPGKVQVRATDGDCEVSLKFVPGPPRL